MQRNTNKTQNKNKTNIPSLRCSRNLPIHSIYQQQFGTTISIDTFKHPANGIGFTIGGSSLAPWVGDDAAIAAIAAVADAYVSGESEPGDWSSHRDGSWC